MKNVLFLIALILVISWTVATYTPSLTGLIGLLLLIALLFLIVHFTLKKSTA
ncbi:MAG: hypothetical protein H7X71_06160 [Chitinophagales bacterium]|nr:hypothetical protein [Chitinophagales bacterium]